MRYSKDRLLRAGLAGLVAGAVGCADAPTASTVAVASPTPQVAAWLASPDLPAIRAMLGDASDRLVRPISEEATRTRLESEVRELSNRLDAGDADGAKQYLALVRRELDGAAAAGISEPDAATFTATLDSVQRLMSGIPILPFSGDDDE